MLKYMYEKAAAVGLSSESIGSIKTLLLLAAFWAVSVAFYSWYEGWTIGGSLTFVIVTMSTVGMFMVYPFHIYSIYKNLLKITVWKNHF